MLEGLGYDPPILQKKCSDIKVAVKRVSQHFLPGKASPEDAFPSTLPVSSANTDSKGMFQFQRRETLKSYCTCCWARRFQTTQTVKRIKKTQHMRKVLRVLSQELPFSLGQSGREARLLQRSEKARTRAHRADWSGLTLPSLTAEVRERWGRRQLRSPRAREKDLSCLRCLERCGPLGSLWHPVERLWRGVNHPVRGPVSIRGSMLGVRRSRAPNSVAASVKKIEQQRVQPVVQKSTSINRNSPPLSHLPGSREVSSRFTGGMGALWSRSAGEPGSAASLCRGSSAEAPQSRGCSTAAREPPTRGGRCWKSLC